MDDKTSLWEKVFSTKGYRVLLFLFSYMVAVAVPVIMNWRERY